MQGFSQHSCVWWATANHRFLKIQMRSCSGWSNAMRPAWLLPRFSPTWLLLPSLSAVCLSKIHMNCSFWYGSSPSYSLWTVCWLKRLCFLSPWTHPAIFEALQTPCSSIFLLRLLMCPPHNVVFACKPRAAQLHPHLPLLETYLPAPFSLTHILKKKKSHAYVVVLCCWLFPMGPTAYHNTPSTTIASLKLVTWNVRDCVLRSNGSPPSLILNPYGWMFLSLWRSISQAKCKWLLKSPG